MTKFRALLPTALLAVAVAQPGPAQTVPDNVLRAELVPGWTEPGGRQVAALHLTLAPGWKTYWRHPGDAGIPPVFDWSGSSNLAGLNVAWPHPQVFDTDGVRTIGYKTEVWLPIAIEARDPSRPVSLKGQAALGVCREVCLPVELGFAAELPPGAAPGPAAPAIRDALDSVPASGSLRGKATCDIAPIPDGLRLTARIAVASQGGEELVFLEPDRGDLWVSPPEVSRAGNTLTASAELVPPDGKPFALDRSAIGFTVLGTDGSVAVRGCSPG